ncbi:hypothetical protein AD006_29290 (plasmid) [Pseudonocardia sp. EC080610-09]|uniref:SDR family NAD(P)-dependent oxidoreductase n=1 Tax=unclassified Pseudonocardia TaxID=2619320 RepID=UPI000706EDE6|nr:MULTISPECIES: SDR family oxidoreductase [unclassified Pseudonocardia]ALL79380.1 hypothetical protein AD006_29290 [Pseudonocardia sp. EC080610-09]ALL85667.1 hypothetical protein AD017_31965 [Pseudonocardia sp. EC080619-01]
MADFAEKVVIVTGGANGMGEATAHRFAQAGANVVIADYDTERGPLVETAIKEAGGTAWAITTDIREETQVGSMVNHVLDRWGRIDVVDNNAASLELAGQDPAVGDLGQELLLDTFRGNLFAMVSVTRAVLPTMLAQGKGTIVNIASVSGMRGELNLSAYGMSKAAVIQFTRAVATQYSRHGIRCNAIAPSYVRTRNNREYGPTDLDRIYSRASAEPANPAPDDIASVALFLASDEARMITGHVVPVDAGLIATSPIVPDYRDWIASQAS